LRRHEKRVLGLDFGIFVRSGRCHLRFDLERRRSVSLLAVDSHWSFGSLSKIVEEIHHWVCVAESTFENGSPKFRHHSSAVSNICLAGDLKTAE